MTNNKLNDTTPEALKIGLLSDMVPSLNRARNMVGELVRKEYADRISRPVEFIKYEYIGAPLASPMNAVTGFEFLADQGCLIIIGGNHSDNCKVVLDTADSRKVPTLSLGASENIVSDYGFTVGWGTIPHDSYILANWCKANGYERITVIIDEAWHVREYVEYLQQACRKWDIRILSVGVISEVSGELQTRQAREVVREHRSLNPDAIIQFAGSSATDAVLLAVHEAKWAVPRATNANFVRICQPRNAANILPEGTDDSYWEAREGWHGTSVVDEENPVLTEMLERFESAFNEKPFLIDAMANYYDAFRVAFEAIVNAHLLSPAGVRDGLHKIKFLPAAAGGKGTVIGFGPYDHNGIKGKDPYVLRKIENGKTPLVHRFDVSL